MLGLRGRNHSEWWKDNELDNRSVAEVIKMLKFDATMLVRRLASLPAPLRVVFAGACAERLLPAFRPFERQECDTNLIGRALEGLWSAPDPADPMETLEAQIELIIALTPQMDEFVGAWTQDVTDAQNAGMAATYALRTRLTGDAQEAAWAAQVAYEALDSFVCRREGIDTNEPGGETKIMAHPLVQAELARQLEDLADLESISPDFRQSVVEQIHARAKVNATRFFGG